MFCPTLIAMKAPEASLPSRVYTAHDRAHSVPFRPITASRGPMLPVTLFLSHRMHRVVNECLGHLAFPFKCHQVREMDLPSATFLFC
jgi:hypothetical protein